MFDVILVLVFIKILCIIYNNMNNETISEKQTLLKGGVFKLLSIVFWIIGILFIMMGVTGNSYGWNLILAGILLLPITKKIIEKRFNIKIQKTIIGIVVIGLLLVGVKEPSAPQIATPEPVKQEVNMTVFDIPLLVGKDLAQIKVILGTPSSDTEPTQLQINSGIDEWEKTWKKGEYSLMVTYDVKTKEVKDLFLSADTDNAFEAFKDRNFILKIGNLERSSNTYSVEFVKALKGDGYTGAIVREK